MARLVTQSEGTRRPVPPRDYYFAQRVYYFANCNLNALWITYPTLLSTKSMKDISILMFCWQFSSKFCRQRRALMLCWCLPRWMQIDLRITGALRRRGETLFTTKLIRFINRTNILCLNYDQNAHPRFHTSCERFYARRCVANEWRRVWTLIFLLIPAFFAESFKITWTLLAV